MTIPLYDRTPVAMDCVDTSQGLQVRVTNDQGTQQLVGDGETVFVELDPARSPLSTKVTVHGGSRDAYVWEDTATGPVRWDRDANGYAHHTYASPAEANLQVVALTAGSPPPAAPPDPSSGQAVLKVKVRKKGDLPL